MNELPILMNAPMVRATRRGLKTQTRRIVVARRVDDIHTWEFHRIQDGYRDGIPRAVFVDSEGEPVGIRSPLGGVGDHLWVRETFSRTGMIKPGDPASYAADWPDAATKWTPSIHMPRALSRIDLEVTDLRVERLSDITEADARAEGLGEVDGMLDDGKIALMAKAMRCCIEDERPSFAALWETIYGAGSWALNPWVWVCGFRVVRGGL